MREKKKKQNDEKVQTVKLEPYVKGKFLPPTQKLNSDQGLPLSHFELCKIQTTFVTHS